MRENIFAKRLFTLSGCLTIFGKKVTIDCVTYETNGAGGYYIEGIDTSKTDDDTLERIYVIDEINGQKVVGVGGGYFPRLNVVTANMTERIYFPFTTEGGIIDFISEDRKNIYALHPGADSFYFEHSSYNGASYSNKITYVISKVVYDKEDFGSKVVVPANIVYFFNYDDSPNGGYFFVDIEEQTGKIIKPPYDPKREDYKFVGWYKDKECTEKWNFEKDVVVVNYDEEGNRIFEELCLYAGWTKE